MAYGVGPALRHERLRRQIPLDEISRQTRISERFLKAIEDEDFEQLPGIIFTRNFVRQYAAVLELDPDPLLSQLPKVDVADSVMPAPPARERRSAWDPRWNSVFSSVAWLVLAAGAAIGAYVHFNRPAVTASASPVADTRVEQKPAEKPAENVAPPTVASVAPPAPAAEVNHRPVQVILTAREESWVQVSADGKVAFTATLQPNDTRTVEADELVKVVAGNAGGIAISLNGKPLDPLGPSGQVRTVRLTAAGPQFPPKIPPPPEPL